VGRELQGTRLRVLIVSASVGAGDLGSARELARRLRAAGHEPTIVDYLEAPPLRIGRALSTSYEAQLRHAPWVYELLFNMWYWAPILLAPVSRVLSLFTRRAVARWVRQTGADVVVSSYSVATQALGDMRRRAASRWPWARRSGLKVPVVSCVTDFGYHPFWAHRSVDLNLTTNATAAARMARRTGRAAITCAPLVGPDFARSADRRPTERRRLRLGGEDVAVLVSSGSWGVGDVKETMELVARSPGLVPVVACGRNTGLRQELEHLARTQGYRAITLGWTDDMAGLMAACDVLVENAGGLTCFEAMRAGLPLVSFRPIPGHGKKSASAMAAAGVSCLAKAGDELVEHIHRVGRPGSARRAMLDAAARLWNADAAELVARVGSLGPPPLPRLRPMARLARAAYALSTAAALVWGGLTTGVGAAAAAGAGVAHPPGGDPGIVYVGARLSPAEIADPAVQASLARLHASAVIDLATAELAPVSVQELTARDVGVESGGASYDQLQASRPTAPWALAQSDSTSVHALSVLSGQPVSALVPDRTLSAFDLVDAGSDNFKVVVPTWTLPAAPRGPYPRDELEAPQLKGGDVYVVDGFQLTPVQLVVLLGLLGSQEAAQHLAGGPLSWLR
jgi:UDP-N-acetylglucosamine:LPS N-acetylglucosamine transferase